LKEKLYEKKGKLNRSIGKDWTQFRARERMSSSVEMLARKNLSHTRMRTWITPAVL